MNSKNDCMSSVLLVIIILVVLGSTKLERAQGDDASSSSVITIERASSSSSSSSSSVCNGTVGECDTGDEVELSLMHHSPGRLLAGMSGDIPNDALRYGDRAVCESRNFYYSGNKCIELKNTPNSIKQHSCLTGLCNRGLGS